MNGEHYELYFGPVRLGVVTETDADFPNLSGTITYDPALADPQTDEMARLARFVALSWESTRLMEQGLDQEQEAIDAELDAHFSDYVESADWHLVDGDGQRQPILCPILGEDEIVWRWNLEEA